MAIEELVFFTVIPICALLTLEAVRNLLGRQPVRTETAPAVTTDEQG
jgi:hypothetical protein